MPKNEKAYKVVSYYLQSTSWQKGKDGLMRPVYDITKIDSAMRRLGIDDVGTFEHATDCLLNIAELFEE